MSCGQRGQLTLRRDGQSQQHPTPVLHISTPNNEASLDQPIHQLYGAVVSHARALRQILDADIPATRKSFDREQRLMLTAGEPGRSPVWHCWW
jgi:hypothetical protein